MEDFVDKPEDYDSVIHGETRFVIFEKQEEISVSFYYKMRKYWNITRKSILGILSSVVASKSN